MSRMIGLALNSQRVEHLMNREKNLLTGLETVHFNVTSGTLGVPKSIPTRLDEGRRISCLYRLSETI